MKRKIVALKLARVLRIILLKLYRGLNNPDFNYVVDSALAGGRAMTITCGICESFPGSARGQGSRLGLASTSILLCPRKQPSSFVTSK